MTCEEMIMPKYFLFFLMIGFSGVPSVYAEEGGLSSVTPTYSEAQRYKDDYRPPERQLPSPRDATPSGSESHVPRLFQLPRNMIREHPKIYNMLRMGNYTFRDNVIGDIIEISIQNTRPPLQLCDVPTGRVIIQGKNHQQREREDILDRVTECKIDKARTAIYLQGTHRTLSGPRSLRDSGDESILGRYLIKGISIDGKERILTTYSGDIAPFRGGEHRLSFTLSDGTHFVDTETAEDDDIRQFIEKGQSFGYGTKRRWEYFKEYPRVECSYEHGMTGPYPFITLHPRQLKITYTDGVKNFFKALDCQYLKNGDIYVIGQFTRGDEDRGSLLRELGLSVQEPPQQDEGNLTNATVEGVVMAGKMVANRDLLERVKADVVIEGNGMRLTNIRSMDERP